MDFKSATDRLLDLGVSLRAISDALGVAHNTVARARMTGENARAAPAEWRPVLARLARTVAEERREETAGLDAIAAELEEGRADG